MQTALVKLGIPTVEPGSNVFDAAGLNIGTVIKLDPFVLTKKVFEEIPDGEVFKIVTTKLQTVHDPFKSNLKFLCKKGHANDWAIYYGLSYTPEYAIASNGDKVMTERCIMQICPCDPEVLSRYRY